MFWLKPLLRLRRDAPRIPHCSNKSDPLVPSVEPSSPTMISKPRSVSFGKRSSCWARRWRSLNAKTYTTYGCRASVLRNTSDSGTLASVGEDAMRTPSFDLIFPI